MYHVLCGGVLQHLIMDLYPGPWSDVFSLQRHIWEALCSTSGQLHIPMTSYLSASRWEDFFIAFHKGNSVWLHFF